MRAIRSEPDAGANDHAGVTLDVMIANAIDGVHGCRPHRDVERAATRPPPFLVCLCGREGKWSRSHFGQRPLHLDRPAFDLERAIILAINQFAFDENLVCRLERTKTSGHSRTIRFLFC
jgi:hypothetical protein